MKSKCTFIPIRYPSAVVPSSVSPFIVPHHTPLKQMPTLSSYLLPHFPFYFSFSQGEGLYFPSFAQDPLSVHPLPLPSIPSATPPTPRENHRQRSRRPKARQLPRPCRGPWPSPCTDVNISSTIVHAATLFVGN